MNNSRDLLKRLLRLFPTKIVKEHFKEKGNSKDAIELITGTATGHAIRSFVKDHQTITRQRIYYYSLKKKFDPKSLDPFPVDINHFEEKDGGYNIFCLPKVSYHVTLYNPMQMDELVFLQPIFITVIKDVLIIRVTKIEKTVSSYYEPERAAFRKGQTKNESQGLESIVEFFDNTFGVSCLDVNKGVKFLWENDTLDGLKVQWRKGSSVATETMDENLTFKQAYPEQYKITIQQPLVKTLFTYLKDDGYLCKAFDTDPTIGQINIPRFPDNTNQVANVITEILKNN